MIFVVVEIDDFVVAVFVECVVRVVVVVVVALFGFLLFGWYFQYHGWYSFHIVKVVILHYYYTVVAFIIFFIKGIVHIIT